MINRAELANAVREALSGLDETQVEMISRSAEWKLVKRNGQWVIVLPVRYRHAVRGRLRFGRGPVRVEYHREIDLDS